MVESSRSTTIPASILSLRPCDDGIKLRLPDPNAVAHHLEIVFFRPASTTMARAAASTSLELAPVSKPESRRLRPEQQLVHLVVGRRNLADRAVRHIFAQ